jgi:hypothetical protein
VYARLGLQHGGPLGGEQLDVARLSGTRLVIQLDVQMDVLLDGALLATVPLGGALLATFSCGGALLDGALLDGALLATIVQMATTFLYTRQWRVPLTLQTRRKSITQ